MSQPSGSKTGLSSPARGLLSLVAEGQEDLAALVEVVNQTFDGVGRWRSHD
jgi:hypothetical protein